MTNATHLDPTNTIYELCDREMNLKYYDLATAVLSKGIEISKAGDSVIDVYVVLDLDEYVWVAIDRQSLGSDFLFSSGQTFADTYEALGNGLTTIDQTFA